MKRLLIALLWLPMLARADYVDEGACAVTPLPTFSVGQAKTVSVVTSYGNYVATVWRQPCVTDPSASVLYVRIIPTSGAPRVSTGDILVDQSGIRHIYTHLIKDPNGQTLIDWLQFGQVLAPRTFILGQYGAPRYDANGQVTVVFETSLGNISVSLDPSTTALPSAAAHVFYSNMTDMWWNADENGTGISIIQHGSNQLFIVWYTYDSAGKPLWIVFPGGAWANAKTFTGSLYQTVGTPLSKPWNQASFAINPVGTGTLTFSSDNTATFTYTISGVSGSKSLTRQRY